jgi:hypothetical protein
MKEMVHSLSFLSHIQLIKEEENENGTKDQSGGTKRFQNENEWSHDVN